MTINDLRKKTSDEQIAKRAKSLIKVSNVRLTSVFDFFQPTYWNIIFVKSCFCHCDKFRCDTVSECGTSLYLIYSFSLANWNPLYNFMKCSISAKRKRNGIKVRFHYLVFHALVRCFFSSQDMRVILSCCSNLWLSIFFCVWEMLNLWKSLKMYVKYILK